MEAGRLLNSSKSLWRVHRYGKPPSSGVQAGRTRMKLKFSQHGWLLHEGSGQ